MSDSNVPPNQRHDHLGFMDDEEYDLPCGELEEIEGDELSGVQQVQEVVDSQEIPEPGASVGKASDIINAQVYSAEHDPRSHATVRALKGFVESTKDEDIRIEIDDAAQTLRRLGPTYTAHLFDRGGQHIGQNLQVRFCVSCDDHMPEIKVYASLIPPPRLKQKKVEEGDQAGQQTQPGQEDQVQEALPEGQEGEAAPEGQGDEPEYLPGDPSVMHKVFAYINYEALTSGKLVAVDSVSRDRMSAEHRAQYFDDVSPAMKQVITDLDNIEGREVHTLRLDLAIDPYKAACEKVWGGTPPWGQEVADLIKSGRFTVLIEGYAVTHRQIQCLSTIMDMCKTPTRPHNPLYTWHTSRKRLVFVEKFLLSKPTFPEGFPEVELAKFKYGNRFAFHSFDEYATVTAIGGKLEHEALCKATVVYEGEHLTLKLMLLPGGGNRVYIGFLSAPSGNLRLSERTSIKIYFGPADIEDVKRPAWSATIASVKLNFGPSEDIPVYVRRHWDKGTSAYDTFKPNVVANMEGTSLLDAAELIDEEQGNVVRVNIINPDKTYKRKMKALELLSFAPTDNAFTQWNVDMRSLLPSYQGDEKHKARDIFATVRASWPDFEDYLNLNIEQLEFFEMAATAPAGVALLQGVPGSGKTHCQIQTASAFFQLPDQIQTVLALAPTNSGADDLATKLDIQLRKLQKDKLVSKLRYVVRLHSLATESSIEKADANTQRLQKNPPIRPQDFDASDPESLPEAAQVAKGVYDADHFKKFPGISDPRVQERDISVGCRMQQIAGVAGYVCDITDPDESRFQAYREQMDLYRTSADMDKNQLIYFRQVCKDMYNYTVENASAVVATPAAASIARNLGILLRTVAIITIDEFARVRDDEILPFLSARMIKCGGLIGFGDHHQLKPSVISDSEFPNPYADAIQLSWMFRLIQQGFPHKILTLQSRMVPEISNIVNQLVYNNTIVNDTSTYFENRGYAAGFSKLIESQNRSKKQTVQFLDVLTGDAVVIGLTSKKSRYCEFYVKLVINLLELQLRRMNNKGYQHATFAIITGYKAQLALYSKAISAMTRAGVPGMERVVLCTIDSCQGHQYDFVYLDLLIAGSLGFLAELRRLNVAITRAKNGMIIVGSSGHLHKAEGHFKTKRHAIKLFDLLTPYKKKIGGTKHNIKCKYFEDKVTNAKTIGGIKAASPLDLASTIMSFGNWDNPPAPVTATSNPWESEQAPVMATSIDWTDKLDSTRPGITEYYEQQDDGISGGFEDDDAAKEFEEDFSKGYNENDPLQEFQEEAFSRRHNHGDDDDTDEYDDDDDEDDTNANLVYETGERYQVSQNHELIHDQSEDGDVVESAEDSTAVRRDGQVYSQSDIDAALIEPREAFSTVERTMPNVNTVETLLSSIFEPLFSQRRLSSMRSRNDHFGMIDTVQEPFYSRSHFPRYYSGSTTSRYHSQIGEGFPGVGNTATTGIESQEVSSVNAATTPTNVESQEAFSEVANTDPTNIEFQEVCPVAIATTPPTNVQSQEVSSAEITGASTIAETQEAILADSNITASLADSQEGLPEETEDLGTAPNSLICQNPLEAQVQRVRKPSAPF